MPIITVDGTCEIETNIVKIKEELSDGLDSREFPGLTYTRDLQNWRDFIRRTPDEAIENFRECLKRVNSREIYHNFPESGFNVIIRDEERTVDETFSLVEDAFKLNIEDILNQRHNN